jgi:hypothetical protein
VASGGHCNVVSINYLLDELGAGCVYNKASYHWFVNFQFHTNSVLDAL